MVMLKIDGICLTLSTNMLKLKNLTRHLKFQKEFIPYMIEKYHHDFEYKLTEILRTLKNQADTNEIFYSIEEKNKLLNLYVDDYHISALNEVLK